MDSHGVTFALVGVGRRCSIYRHLLEKTIRTTNSTFSITREEEIDQLSIQGIISIAEKAGILI